MSTCPFCLPNDDLYGEVIFKNDFAYALTNPDKILEHSCMIIPHRHTETPFELTSEEWQSMHSLMQQVKTKYDAEGAEGYTVGWNVYSVGGQHVPHAHLHIISRFADEPLAGKGLRAHIKQPSNARPK